MVCVLLLFQNYLVQCRWRLCSFFTTKELTDETAISVWALLSSKTQKPLVIYFRLANVLRNILRVLPGGYINLPRSEQTLLHNTPCLGSSKKATEALICAAFLQN
jgi:hypothetical protein